MTVGFKRRWCACEACVLDDLYEICRTLEHHPDPMAKHAVAVAGARIQKIMLARDGADSGRSH